MGKPQLILVTKNCLETCQNGPLHQQLNWNGDTRNEFVQQNSQPTVVQIIARKLTPPL